MSLVTVLSELQFWLLHLKLQTPFKLLTLAEIAYVDPMVMKVFTTLVNHL